jgi:hypothetical protein
MAAPPADFQPQYPGKAYFLMGSFLFPPNSQPGSRPPDFDGSGPHSALVPYTSAFSLTWPVQRCEPEARARGGESVGCGTA